MKKLTLFFILFTATLIYSCQKEEVKVEKEILSYKKLESIVQSSAYANDYIISSVNHFGEIAANIEIYREVGENNFDAVYKKYNNYTDFSTFATKQEKAEFAKITTYNSGKAIKRFAIFKNFLSELSDYNYNSNDLIKILIATHKKKNAITRSCQNCEAAAFQAETLSLNSCIGGGLVSFDECATQAGTASAWSEFGCIVGGGCDD
jgi:hypothetical protein